eukprot:TRINITY_DN64114_c0_g1_i2.p1 TRINITY_DN64114_c0_g1~~TRINITY_DN64114_c0_g1_i2.p1  ORF type:complete len:738 (-),score=167.11 TRINITY_DN64114_c0_g1_i2:87-2300(-)
MQGPMANDASAGATDAAWANEDSTGHGAELDIVKRCIKLIEQETLTMRNQVNGPAGVSPGEALAVSASSLEALTELLRGSRGHEAEDVASGHASQPDGADKAENLDCLKQKLQVLQDGINMLHVQIEQRSQQLYRPPERQSAAAPFLRIQPPAPPTVESCSRPSTPRDQVALGQQQQQQPRQRMTPPAGSGSSPGTPRKPSGNLTPRVPMTTSGARTPPPYQRLQPQQQQQAGSRSSRGAERRPAVNGAPARGIRPGSSERAGGLTTPRRPGSGFKAGAASMGDLCSGWTAISGGRPPRVPRSRAQDSSPGRSASRSNSPSSRVRLGSSASAAMGSLSARASATLRAHGVDQSPSRSRKPAVLSPRQQNGSATTSSNARSASPPLSSKAAALLHGHGAGAGTGTGTPRTPRAPPPLGQRLAGVQSAVAMPTAQSSTPRGQMGSSSGSRARPAATEAANGPACAPRSQSPPVKHVVTRSASSTSTPVPESSLPPAWREMAAEAFRGSSGRPIVDRIRLLELSSTLPAVQGDQQVIWLHSAVRWADLQETEAGRTAQRGEDHTLFVLHVRRIDPASDFDREACCGRLETPLADGRIAQWNVASVKVLASLPQEDCAEKLSMMGMFGAQIARHVAELFAEPASTHSTAPEALVAEVAEAAGLAPTLLTSSFSEGLAVESEGSPGVFLNRGDCKSDPVLSPQEAASRQRPFQVATPTTPSYPGGSALPQLLLSRISQMHVH